MITYLEDFKSKFPNCRWNDKEIITKHCVDDFYRADVGVMEKCEKIVNYGDCKKCWNEEIKEADKERYEEKRFKEDWIKI